MVTGQTRGECPSYRLIGPAACLPVTIVERTSNVDSRIQSSCKRVVNMPNLIMQPVSLNMQAAPRRVVAELGEAVARMFRD